MTTIRAFIALSLPAQVTEALAAVGHELAPRVPERSVKWVTPERMHLTLRFLGETPVANVEGIGRAMEEVGSATAPFSLQLDRLGCFPNERRPRVIWVGLEGDVESLRALKERLDRALAPLGWEPERRRFQAHLTLGRVKRQQGAIKLPWGTSVVPESWQVDALHLIESRLRPAGPVYTQRHSARLGAGPAPR